MLEPIGFPQPATDRSPSDRMPLTASVTAPWRAAITAALLSLAIAGALGERLTAEHPIAAAGHRLAAPHGLASLPIAARGVVSATLGAESRAYRVRASGGVFAGQNSAQGLQLRFRSAGAQITSGTLRLSIGLRAAGFGASLTPLRPVAPSAKANRVTYTHAELSEWYVNGPLGLEQGFTVAHAPPGDATRPLTLSMALSGHARASLASDGRGVAFNLRGGPSLMYTGLSATDASGRELHSWMELRAGQVLLRVDAHHARYPLWIDPFFSQQGGKLTGSGEIGKGDFGLSVAMSGDGTTALIAAPNDNGQVGAAWVFARARGTWGAQGGKITGSGEIEKGRFGAGVALSRDGSTALIGGPADNSSVGAKEVGAVWEFQREGSTWKQVGPKFTSGGTERERFGKTVALSDEANTALIGGEEAAWVFTREGSTWKQQGAKLTSGEEPPTLPAFGSSVALSADGSTALIGGYQDDAAWVFVRSGSAWEHQGKKLTGTGHGLLWFGFSVALSDDGNTALIGGPLEEEGGFTVGAAWVFIREGSAWKQQGEKLRACCETGVSGSAFGTSVALSGDGNTALIGGPGDNKPPGESHGTGAAWVFTRSGSTWFGQPAKFTGTGQKRGEAEFGTAVAMSDDANTAVIGGPLDNSVVGAAWTFSAHAPTVTKVTPKQGATSGGTTVTITGTNFTSAESVRFGSTSAASFEVTSSTSITAVSPVNAAGTVDVTVSTFEGTSSTSSADRFSFTPTVTNLSPNTGSKAGGTSVTVAGTGFALGKTATSFKFGTTKGTSVNCTSSTTCTVVSPARAVGAVDVTATVSKATSPKNPPADQFTYN